MEQTQQNTEQMTPYPEKEMESSGRRSGRKRNAGLPYRSPSLAAWLSLCPGLGQAYVGYYPQGFQNILFVATSIALLTVDMSGSLKTWLAIFLVFFWIFNLVDAFRRAVLVNRALDGLSDQELPEDFTLPGISGSLPIGVVLIVAGSLIFLHTKFDYSLVWLEDWWPVGLIAAGGWMVVRSRQK